MDLAKGVQMELVTPEELADWAARSREITGYDILQFMRRTA
jgi:hypothetical protein